MQSAQDYWCFYLEPLTIVSWLSRMFPTVLSLFYMAVISLDRCYACAALYSIGQKSPNKVMRHFACDQFTV